MWKWIYLLFHPCRHKWELLQKVNVFEFDSSERPCEIKLIMRCTKCGDIKKKII